MTILPLTPQENEIINLINDNLVEDYVQRDEIIKAFALILSINITQASEIYEQCLNLDRTFHYTKG